MDADCRYVIVQRPGGIRGWNSAVQAFDSTCGYPGEGPSAPTRSKKEITSYFQKTERRTLPSQPKPATSNQNRIQLERLLPLDLESNTVTDSTPMPIDMNSDSRYWECDSCTLENNSLSLVCEGCGGNRADPDRVVCDGDNPDEAESEAKRIQRAYDQQKFVVDFNFGVSVVPGYQTFAIKDLDEYVQASKREPVGCTQSEMLILNLFSCNYPAVAAVHGWDASQHGCAVSTFHRSYQGSYNNCGQIAVGVMSALERGDWSWNLDDNDFDKEMRSIAKSCNNDATNRAATTDDDLAELIKRRLGGTYDSNLKYGGVIARSFLETVHLTLQQSNTFGKKSCIRGYGRTHKVWKKGTCLSDPTIVEANSRAVGIFDSFLNTAACHI